MSRSTWVYETTYQASASAAFEALQGRVFEEGSYDRPWDGRFTTHADELVAAFERMELLDELLDEMAGLGKVDTFDRLRRGADPRDRVEAVLWSGAGGTRSILDAEKVEPLLRAEITRLFGAPHPEIVVVRAREALLHEAARPDTQYLVAYEEGFPAALFFFGLSGGE